MDSMEQLAAEVERYPYPLAVRFVLYQSERPEGFQCRLWTRRLVHDAIQYATLLLVADAYRNRQAVPLLPCLDLKDWIELLEKVLREDMLRVSGRRAISRTLADVCGDWAQSSLEFQDEEIHWYECAKTRADFPPADWDEGFCGRVVCDLWKSLEPLASFQLGWTLGGAGILNLSGSDPAKWKEATVSDSRVPPGRIVACGENGVLELSPFFHLDPPLSPISFPDILMWDGDVSRDRKAIYHSESQARLVETSAVRGYAELQMARILPDSSYSGLLRRSYHHVHGFLARQSQGGRYPFLTRFPRQELVAELNNFLAGKYHCVALLGGGQGVGKRNAICDMAQQWTKEEHLVIILEAADITPISLKNAASQIFGKNHTWEFLFKQVPDGRGKRCVVVVVGLERHPELPALLDALRKFWRKYGNSSFPIRLVLEAETDFMVPHVAQLPEIMAEDLLYHPVQCVSEHSPALIELLPLKAWEVENLYRQCEKSKDRRPGADFGTWSAESKKRMAHPIWLALLSLGKDWKISCDLQKDQILCAHLDQFLWESPSLWDELEACLPLFRNRWEVDAGELGSPRIRKAFSELCRRGILQQRTDVAEHLAFAFSLPIVRDFLIAWHAYRRGDTVDLVSGSSDFLNRNAQTWAFVLHFLHDRTLPDALWEAALQNPQTLGLALAEIDEIRSVGEERNLVRSICERLAQRENGGVEALIAFLQESGRRKAEKTFAFLLDLLWDIPRISASHCSRMLRIVALHFPLVEAFVDRDWQKKLKQAEPYVIRNGLRQMARLHLGLGDLDKALENARFAFEITEQEQPEQELWQDWQLLAECHAARREFAEAKDFYEKILQMAHQLNAPQLFLSSQRGLALLQAQMNSLVAAMNCYDEILGVAEDIGDQLSKIKALRGKGSLYKSGKQNDESLKFYELACSLALSLADYPQACEISKEIASLYQNEGEDALALSYYEKALRFSGQYGSPAATASVLSDLAGYFDDQGESEKAIAQMRRAVDLFRQEADGERLAAALSALGMLYDAQDLLDEALGAYQEAVEILRDRPASATSANNLKNLAVLFHRRKDKESSREFFLKARNAFEKLHVEEELKSIDDWLKRIK